MRRVELFVTLAVLLPSAVSRAATLLVPQQFPTIQQALDAAANGDTVLIAPGDYLVGHESLGANQKRITIQGSGVDVTTLVLNGAIHLDGPSQGDPQVLTQCTIRGAAPYTGSIYGSRNAEITHCKITDLHNATFSVETPGQILALRFCTVTGYCGRINMQATFNGGTVLVEDTSFVGVIAQQTGPEPEGPLRMQRGYFITEAVLRRCSFLCNQGAAAGAALQGNPSLVEDCVFVNNAALYQGGALSITPSPTGFILPVAISNCHFFANSAPMGGAVAAFSDVVLSVSASEFSNNAGDIGGGVLSIGPVLVTDTAFCGNAGGDIIAGGTYGSGNTFDVDCGPDCDEDGVPDDSAIALGLVEDLDEDGVPDHCVPAFFSADINGDCQVNGADLGMVIAGWGANSGVADINQDDLVDGSDLALVLGQWTSM